MRNALHFVGFKNQARIQGAIRVFGFPDFWHRQWDARAKAEIQEGDTAIFAEGSEADEPRAVTYDDSAHQ